MSVPHLHLHVLGGRPLGLAARMSATDTGAHEELAATRRRPSRTRRCSPSCSASATSCCASSSASFSASTIAVAGNELRIDRSRRDARRPALRRAAAARSRAASTSTRPRSSAPSTWSASDLRPSEVLGQDILRGQKGKPVRPHTAGQKRYTDAIAAQHDHVRDRAGRHGQELPRGRRGGPGAPAPRGAAHRAHPTGRRGRGAARLPARATSWRRSTRTFGRSTTPSTTCSVPTGTQRLLEKGTVEVAPLAFMRGGRSTARSSSSTRRRTRRPSR